MENNMVEFAKNSQVVKFEEISKGANEGASDLPVEDQILELAEKKVASDKVTLTRAIEIVLSENVELAKKYRGDK
jgi:hypothetical protein